MTLATGAGLGGTGMAMLAAAVSVVVASVALELGARYIFRHWIRYRMCTPWQRLVLEPLEEISPYLPKQAESRYDSLGLRVSEPGGRGNPSVWVIGGSSAECAFLDQGQDWPSRLEALLQETKLPTFPSGKGLRVSNLARSGHDSGSSLRALGAYLGMGHRPDCVLHALGFSDVIRWVLIGTPADQAAPSLTDDRVFTLYPGRPFGWSREGSAALQGLKLLYFRLSGKKVVLERSGRHMVKCRRARALQNWVEPPPMPEVVIRQALDNIRSFQKLCREAGVRYVLVLLPWNEPERFSPEEDSLLWFGRWNETNAPAGAPWSFVRTEQLFDRFGQMDTRARELCEADGIECVALRRAVPTDFRHFYDEAHITPLGAEVVAKAMLDRLSRLG